MDVENENIGAISFYRKMVIIWSEFSIPIQRDKTPALSQDDIGGKAD